MCRLNVGASYPAGAGRASAALSIDCSSFVPRRRFPAGLSCPEKESGGMTKILVIDDDVIVRETLIQILEDHGYQVVSAEDGKRGVASFHTQKPDLVITDLIMPEKEDIQHHTGIP